MLKLGLFDFPQYVCSADFAVGRAVPSGCSEPAKMDVHDGAYAELPLADSWTDFFSAVQDEHPVPAPAFTAHEPPQQQHQHQQVRASQYVAPEPVQQPRESCSIDKLVQVTPRQPAQAS